MNDEQLIINTASVKVMRSHDYCHFEVALGATLPEGQIFTIDGVDKMRKVAARLADKAVEQYKIAKSNFETLERERREWEWEARRLEAIKEKPEHERTPEEAAALKAHGDHLFRARYDYEDDWHDDER
jgi:hypothetical protein